MDAAKQLTCRQMEDPQERSSGDSSRSNADVIVNIPSLAQALEQELARHRRQVGVGGSTPCTPSIGMVGELTRNVDPQEYDPHHVSIGPYHRKRCPNVAGKLASLDAILSAASPPAAKTVTAYLAELAADEARARSYYADTLDDMAGGEFLRMLLLDACYVLSWFVLARGNKQEMAAVVRDVFYLVENQIPYFILDKVHKLTFPAGGRGGVVPVSETIAEKLQYILQKQQYTTARIKPPEEPGNLLHLVHMHFLKPTTTVTSVASSSSPTAGQQKVGRWRTAMDYHISGVNLKSRPIVADDAGAGGSTGARCILDVMLDSGSGTLLVPCLSINSDTSGMLRNLVALEQQNPGVGSHVTAYCVFMSQVACTARDVELLSRRGIIVHLLGNHGEVATLFSDLCKGVLFDPDDADRNYLRATCQELDKWYGSRRRRWMALLWHKYFANPWLAIGVMAAAIGLVSTLLQTLYTALSYYRSTQ